MNGASYFLLCVIILMKQIVAIFFTAYFRLLAHGDREIIGRCHIAHELLTAKENILPDRHVEMLSRPTAQGL